MSKKRLKFKSSFHRWNVINSSANYVSEMLNSTNQTLNLEKIIVSMMKGSVDDIDWMSKRQMDGLKRDVIKHLNAIEERDMISFRLGNIKKVQKIDYKRLII